MQPLLTWAPILWYQLCQCGLLLFNAELAVQREDGQSAAVGPQRWVADKGLVHLGARKAGSGCLQVQGTSQAGKESVQ
jgi:hypothetical protein